MKTILIIDDDKDFRFLTKRQLTESGFNCLECSNSAKAFELLETEQVHLILSDLNLRKENGKEILERVVNEFPAIPLIIVTGYANVRSTVDLMRIGAADYLMKPLDLKQLHAAISRALREHRVFETADPARTERGSEVPSYTFSSSEFVIKTLESIDIVAPTNYSDIIYGESGSGKEAFASEIHRRSSRKSKPLVAIDCGALSKELSASTLFGHEKGAFTGAISEKEGVFESANGGTVFLDEIANLPYEVQVSLLRMTQERKIRRVGGTREIPVDVRLVVASNVRLWDSCLRKEFREDLYHRLNEFAIDILPLRERRDDVVFYAKVFLKEANRELGKNVSDFSSDALNLLQNHSWPGNLRELRNVVRRAVLSCTTDDVRLKDLSWYFDNAEGTVPSLRPLDVNIESSRLEANESLLKALQDTGFNKRKLASIMNVDAKTLNTKLKDLA